MIAPSTLSLLIVSIASAFTAGFCFSYSSFPLGISSLAFGVLAILDAFAEGAKSAEEDEL